MRDEYTREEKFELAADAQQQLRELKQSLFDILISDRYNVEQREDQVIEITLTK